MKFIMETPFVLEKGDEKEVYKVGLPPQLINGFAFEPKKIIRRAAEFSSPSARSRLLREQADGARRDNSPIWEEDPRSVESHLKVPYLHNRIDFPKDDDEQEINNIYRKAQNIRKSLKGVANFSQNRIWQYKINSADCTRNHIVEVTWNNEKQEQKNLQNEADNQQELQRVKAYEAAARESAYTHDVHGNEILRPELSSGDDGFPYAEYADQQAAAALGALNRLRSANVNNATPQYSRDAQEALRYARDAQYHANAAIQNLLNKYHLKEYDPPALNFFA